MMAPASTNKTRRRAIGASSTAFTLLTISVSFLGCGGGSNSDSTHSAQAERRPTSTTCEVQSVDLPAKAEFDTGGQNEGPLEVIIPGSDPKQTVELAPVKAQYAKEVRDKNPDRKAKAKSGSLLFVTIEVENSGKKPVEAGLVRPLLVLEQSDKTYFQAPNSCSAGQIYTSKHDLASPQAPLKPGESAEIVLTYVVPERSPEVNLLVRTTAKGFTLKAS